MHLPVVGFSSLVNYIPVAATVVTTALSVILARATLRYAAASDKSLALAREEFEREWSPELHIKLERLSTTDARIIVTNLAKISVLLQMVQVRRLTHAVPSLRYFLNEPLVGGTTWSDGVSERLLAATGGDFQGPIAVSITFYASGRLFRTDWFRFQLEVNRGNLLRLDPVNMAARRVRVLEPRNGQGRIKQELVRDVTAVPADETPAAP
jgi:cell division protein FtsL